MAAQDNRDDAPASDDGTNAGVVAQPAHKQSSAEHHPLPHRTGFFSRVRHVFSRVHHWVKVIEPWSILFAVFALIVSLVTFCVDYNDRVKERTVRAWQLLTT